MSAREVPDGYSPERPECDGDGNLPPRRCCRDRACPCDVEPGECPGCSECSRCPDCEGTGENEDPYCGEPNCECRTADQTCSTCDGHGWLER